MLSVGTIAFSGGVAITVGVMIGAIGIGGVLLVPLLVYVLGVSIHSAIAIAMFSYLFSGTVGAFEYVRRGSIQWRLGFWLCLGGMPGAYAGAMTGWLTPGVILESAIGLLVLLTGAQALRPESQNAHASDSLAPAVLLGIGVFTGFISAITGTGGPLVLVPLLIWLKVPALAAVGLSQIIQIPIALLATGGNLIFGQVDFALALGISAMLVIGVIFGARLAHRLSRETLKRFIAFVLLAVGATMLARIISRLF
ncbi:MAG: hypothetical protein CL395_09405 [Acidiferrobacteraceae bacterium]|jgi:hypothetical protein|nr:hypothetical protein [Acidiferrobacteraceae bacterium]HJP07707.1 sulfite exporter TauE/SafE family protein [Arenicellales bacterium]